MIDLRIFVELDGLPLILVQALHPDNTVTEERSTVTKRLLSGSNRFLARTTFLRFTQDHFKESERMRDLTGDG
jgi:hypothetical protein